jgi:hypothetical protein
VWLFVNGMFMITRCQINEKEQVDATTVRKRAFVRGELVVSGESRDILACLPLFKPLTKMTNAFTFKPDTSIFMKKVRAARSSSLNGSRTAAKMNAVGRVLQEERAKARLCTGGGQVHAENRTAK